jgi:hypothetical protein
MPHGAKLKEIQETFERAVTPYFQPGNLIAHNMYDALELPWMADPTQTAFPKDRYQRFDWDRGSLSNGREFFGGTREYSLEVVKKGLDTVSAVTRWREAHPELAGTEQDCVSVIIEQMRQLLGETQLRGGGATALLMFKRGE